MTTPTSLAEIFDMPAPGLGAKESPAVGRRG